MAIPLDRKGNTAFVYLSLESLTSMEVTIEASFPEPMSQRKPPPISNEMKLQTKKAIKTLVRQFEKAKPEDRFTMYQNWNAIQAEENVMEKNIEVAKNWNI